MTEPTAQELLSELQALKAQLGPAVQRINDKEDGGRKAGGEAMVADLSGQITERLDKLAALDKREADAARKAEIDEAVKAALHNVRKGSMASSIGTGSEPQQSFRAPAALSGAQKAAGFGGDYVTGSFLSGLMDSKGIGVAGFDPELVAAGKAALSRLGVDFRGVPEASKATLGTTGVTGGYVLPNNFVDSVQKPNTQQAFYQTLITSRNGINVRGVDQPFRNAAAAIATFAPWGNTKSNLNEAYNTYTANLGTLALVYDIGKQYARFSAGSAEADVMDELQRGFALAENKAIIAGAGSVNTGTGDPTFGVYTALNAVTTLYTTSFSPVATTQAGSAAAGFVKIMGDLATRSRVASAIVLDAITYWTIVGQGTDTAGFWVAPTEGPTGFTRTASGEVAFWGVPMYFDSNYNTNTSTTKGCIVGDWKELKFYRGMEFRIDTSDVAGTRWDQNLIGFRGEEEIGINAYSAVLVGAFQLCTSIIA